MSDDRLPPQQLPKLGEPPLASINRELLPPTSAGGPTNDEPPQFIASAPHELISVVEPPKLDVSSTRRVAIRRLSPAEKAQRRLVKNAILFGVCIIVLVIVFYFLAR